MIPADSHSTDPQTLVSALDSELSTLVQVLDMLDIEHEALLGTDPERLEQAVVAKQNAIAAHLKSRSHRESLGLRDSFENSWRPTRPLLMACEREH